MWGRAWAQRESDQRQQKRGQTSSPRRRSAAAPTAQDACVRAEAGPRSAGCTQEAAVARARTHSAKALTLRGTCGTSRNGRAQCDRHVREHGVCGQAEEPPRPSGGGGCVRASPLGSREEAPDPSPVRHRDSTSFRADLGPPHSLGSLPESGSGVVWLRAGVRPQPSSSTTEMVGPRHTPRGWEGAQGASTGLGNAVLISW